MMRHFLDIDELSKDELEHVLDLSSQPATTAPLAGKGMALLFEKPSARTRNAMEMAVVQLGGHPVYIRPDELGLDVRESVEDVARTFACYHDLLGARVFAHATVERMAALDAIPVVNLLSDKSHPMQALGDLLTMRSELSVLEDRTITFIGDANNVALSLVCAGAKPILRLASCCSVEVVKGACGLRRAGFASTVDTEKLAASIAFLRSSASAPVPMSSL
jgi:ornithine carbamoyltransferase